MSMSWLSKLFRRKLICAVCGVQLKKLSEAKADDNPLGELFKSSAIVPFSENLGFQCTKCKKLLCPAHTKQLIFQIYSVDTCSFCSAPMNLLQ
jgi:hypothetical protein